MTTLEALLVSWLTNEPPPRHIIPYMHLRLWKAVADQAAHMHSMDCMWSPTEDPRIRWAVQYLDQLSNPKSKVCPHLRDTTEFLLQKFLPEKDHSASGKELAAHNND